MWIECISEATVSILAETILCLVDDLGLFLNLFHFPCMFCFASDDDVDLEALVNDMASLSSYESIYATCGTRHSDSDPLLHSTDGSVLHGNRVAPLPRAPRNKVTAPHSPAQKLRRSQPMHIQAVR